MDIITPGGDEPGAGAPDAGPPDVGPDVEVLAQAVRRLARTSVMVIGDVMLDRYVFGSVTRISPEAPIPILTVERELAMPGGAGKRGAEPYGTGGRRWRS